MSIQLIGRSIRLYLNRGTPGAATVDGEQVFTNKSIALGGNNLTGTKAQFNTALTDGNFLFDGDAQPADADLAAIAALVGTTGLLRKTGANAWALDTAAYQTQQSVTGLVKSSGTTRSVAEAGTDYVAPGGELGTPSSGSLANCTADGSNPVGFRNIPLVSAAVNTTLTKAHAGGGLKHPASDTTARTYTVASNATQSWDDGTTLTIWNVFGTGGLITINVTTDPVRFAADGSTGSRTLARGGFATLVWDATSASWGISGAGLS